MKRNRNLNLSDSWVDIPITIFMLFIWGLGIYLFNDSFFSSITIIFPLWVFPGAILSILIIYSLKGFYTKSAVKILAKNQKYDPTFLGIGLIFLIIILGSILTIGIASLVILEVINTPFQVLGFIIAIGIEKILEIIAIGLKYFIDEIDFSIKLQ